MVTFSNNNKVVLSFSPQTNLKINPLARQHLAKMSSRQLVWRFIKFTDKIKWNTVQALNWRSASMSPSLLCVSALWRFFFGRFNFFKKPLFYLNRSELTPNSRFTLGYYINIFSSKTLLIQKLWWKLESLGYELLLLLTLDLWIQLAKKLKSACGKISEKDDFL